MATDASQALMADLEALAADLTQKGEDRLQKIVDYYQMPAGTVLVGNGKSVMARAVEIPNPLQIYSTEPILLVEEIGANRKPKKNARRYKIAPLWFGGQSTMRQLEKVAKKKGIVIEH